MNENTIPDSVIEKIRKLLRMSKSDNQNEVEQSLAHCQRLALQYSLDISTIDAYKDSKITEEIVKDELNLDTKRKSSSSKFVLWILKRHFNVEAILDGSRYSGQKIAFIGSRSSIENACYLYQYLNNTFSELWKKEKLSLIFLLLINLVITMVFIRD